ncbi:MAG TPA: hypothetical protein DC060_07760 [Gemmatimonadetes bacterium]|nr:hypothetical protein [Gemmatimonadota bacterium]
MVLRKASEIEEREGSAGSGGLSLEDLQEIAREVGIAPEAIAKAADGLDTGRVRTHLLAGAPAAYKAVHAVRGELNDEALGQLIGLMDDETDSAGAIAEALGTVRWAARDRFRTTAGLPDATERRDRGPGSREGASTFATPDSSPPNRMGHHVRRRLHELDRRDGCWNCGGVCGRRTGRRSRGPLLLEPGSPRAVARGSSASLRRFRVTPTTRARRDSWCWRRSPRAEPGEPWRALPAPCGVSLP